MIPRLSRVKNELKVAGEKAKSEYEDLVKDMYNYANNTNKYRKYTEKALLKLRKAIEKTQKVHHDSKRYPSLISSTKDAYFEYKDAKEAFLTQLSFLLQKNREFEDSSSLMLTQLQEVDMRRHLVITQTFRDLIQLEINLSQMGMDSSGRVLEEFGRTLGCGTGEGGQSGSYYAYERELREFVAVAKDKKKPQPDEIDLPDLHSLIAQVNKREKHIKGSIDIAAGSMAAAGGIKLSTNDMELLGKLGVHAHEEEMHDSVIQASAMKGTVQKAKEEDDIFDLSGAEFKPMQKESFSPEQQVDHQKKHDKKAESRSTDKKEKQKSSKDSKKKTSKDSSHSSSKSVHNYDPFLDDELDFTPEYVQSKSLSKSGTTFETDNNPFGLENSDDFEEFKAQPVPSIFEKTKSHIPVHPTTSSHRRAHSIGSKTMHHDGATQDPSLPSLLAAQQDPISSFEAMQRSPDPLPSFPQDLLESIKKEREDSEGISFPSLQSLIDTSQVNNDMSDESDW
ncbi:hypothetical protein ADUPG1_010707 [Aduncisulcus paluster]|uniref:Uncharacterized protein n=1 Tax=Aduncisulcus paluster TaxID=2918883 RepID=A0ABQ5JSY3_9EUKA|nr:hypothetical protein ADUPG1_010707 [Aduncisulcus paluster]